MKIEIDIAKYKEKVKEINSLLEDVIGRLKRMGVEVLSYNSLPEEFKEEQI